MASLEERLPEEAAEIEAVLMLLMDVFSDYGFRAVSMRRIEECTGLSKGRLRQMFPGGKDEMAAEVLEYIENWFQDEVFDALQQEKPGEAVVSMLRFLELHFRAGRRVGLIGSFLLDDDGDRFAIPIRRLFIAWIAALNAALVRAGVDEAVAWHMAEDAVAGIQGGMLLSAALKNEAVFTRALCRSRTRLETLVGQIRTRSH